MMRVLWVWIFVSTASATEIACPGLPGPIAVFGENARAAVMAGDDTVVARSEYGLGRVVLFGHGGFFEKDHLNTADTAKYIAESFQWASNGTTDVYVKGFPGFAKAWSNAAFKIHEWPKTLPPKGILLVSPASCTAEDLKAIDAFVLRGGGLIAGTPGWGWRQTHNNQTLDKDFQFNAMLAPMGLAFADSTISKPKSGTLTVAIGPMAANAAVAVDRIHRWLVGSDTIDSADAAIMQSAILNLQGAVPAKQLQPFNDALRKLLTQHAGKITIPEPKKPLTESKAAERLLFALSVKLATDAAHPAVAMFPGEVKTKERVSKTIRINVFSKGYICNGVGVSAKADIWHSTGLYAAPGEEITITIPEKAGLGVRIGAHTDQLWDLKSWKRSPGVSRSSILSATTKTRNPFGGLIYITAKPGLELGEMDVKIENAVTAPLYIRGKTTKAEWQAMRESAAPWAEIGSNKIIVTISTTLARGIDDPGEIIEFWDKVMDADADLTCVSRERGRAERIVHDVQISAGYMHSGYPIMAPLNEAERFVDIRRVQREGAWGYFHELGHNHQQPAWTFDGTVEVTCNLYSLYCYEKFCPQAALHEAIQPAAIKKHAVKYFKDGSKFETWKAEPFTALIMYHQLQKEFGWAAFDKAIRDYPAVKANQKIDTWMIRMSQATGKNLAPFFAHWGLPLSDDAKKQVAGLAEWKFPDATK